MAGAAASQRKDADTAKAPVLMELGLKGEREGLQQLQDLDQHKTLDYEGGCDEEQGEADNVFMELRFSGFFLTSRIVLSGAGAL